MSVQLWITFCHYYCHMTTQCQISVTMDTITMKISEKAAIHVSNYHMTSTKKIWTATSQDCLPDPATTNNKPSLKLIKMKQLTPPHADHPQDSRGST